MILILGGGIAGASLARALVHRGARDVEVHDPAQAGSGSTGRATGGFRTQFGASLNIELSLASRPYFATNGSHIGFRSNGYAFIGGAPGDVTRLDDWREVQLAAGLPVVRDDASRIFPGLRFDHASCNLCMLDGTYDPTSVLRLFTRQATDGGARFFYRSSNSPDPNAAEAAVVAAGIWSKALGATLGVQLDVRSEERHVWILGGAAIDPEMPLGVDLNGGWVFREREGGLLLASPPSLTDPADALKSWIATRLDHPTDVRVDRQWTGMYEVTLDRHPFVGRTERSHVWASCGFSGHGVMHAPAIADSLAAMILGDSPPIDLQPLSPLRRAPLLDPTLV
jgi:sarcosine oxidase subunit beta